jgi:adenosylhomocysteinase
MKSIIDNINLKEAGSKRMKWFRSQMPILKRVEREILESEKPFENLVIAICMHVEPKTAYWIEGLLKSNVKHIYLIGCLGTTKADTAAYLSTLEKVTVFAKENDTYEQHIKYCEKVLSNECDILLDNGASLINTYHSKDRDYTPIGANEETRSGKLLIEKNNTQLNFPVIVIDDSPLKQLLENAIGVGHSVVDGFMRSTSLLVSGKNVLIVGYGYCGYGIAKKFRGYDANTYVYDIDPLYMLKARTEGHRVGKLNTLIEAADIIITVTGQFDVINSTHIPYFKDNLILANSGHYGFEINTDDIKNQSVNIEIVKSNVERIDFNGKSINLISNAAPINLSAADGNPIEIMDIGLALQTLSAIRLVNDNSLENKMIKVPDDISREVSKLSLNI